MSYWAGAFGDGLGIVAPEPAEGVGENRGAVNAVVSFIADDEGMVVAGVSEGHIDIFVGAEPAAGVDALVVAAILHKDTESFGFGFADERAEGLRATEVGKAADVAEDTAELVGPVPGGDEGGAGTGGGAGDGAIIGVRG